MEKFIAYEKLSKKKQRELNAKRRSSWGGVNPVTRKSANPKAYNRAKARKWILKRTANVLNAGISFLKNLTPYLRNPSGL